MFVKDGRRFFLLIDKSAVALQKIGATGENLASAGFDANEIISAMPGMLALATSSGESLVFSSDIAAYILTPVNVLMGNPMHFDEYVDRRLTIKMKKSLINSRERGNLPQSRH